MAIAGATYSRTNWEQFAYTIDNIKRTAIEHTFSYCPELAVFASQSLGDFGGTPMRGRGHESVGGGQGLIRRVILGAYSGASRGSSPYSAHNVNPDENTRFAEANWKWYLHGLSVAQHNLLINRGDEAIGNYLVEQTTQCLRALADLVADDLTNASAPATGVTPIPDLISANDTIHNLSGATFLNYNARGVSARGTAPASVSFASGSFSGGVALPDLRTAYHNASEGTVQPDFHLTSYENVERLEAIIQPQERYTGGVGTANTGFTAMSFMGKPVLPSPKVSQNASGDWYMISVDAEQGIRLKVLSGSDFDFEEWKPSTTQRAMVRPLSITCELMIGNRKFGCNKVTSLAD